MKLRALILSLLPALVSLSFAVPCNGYCRTDSLYFEWRRISMDAHRPASPTALSEQALLDSCAPEMSELKTVLAQSTRALSSYRPESPLSNWLADALIEQTSLITGRPCDACVVNFGGIRTDLPEGNVVEDDIRSMLPFRNTVVVAMVRGNKLLALMEHMAGNQWEVLGGIRVTASLKGVQSVTVAGQPLDTSRLYSVVTNSFIFEGGDGISIKAISESHFDSGKYIVDVVRDHLKSLSARGLPIEGRVDGRVTLLDHTVPQSAHDGASHAAVAGVLPSPPAPAGGKKCLTIIHTNDTHSHLEPVRYGRNSGMGGVVERAAFMDSLRKADGRGNVLLLDAGDYSQGTSYFSIFKGDVEVEAMNRMGYDVATVGNHEWDNGVGELARRLRNASFRNVLCNYTVADKQLSRCLEPFVIIRRGGLKIGIIGILADVSEVVSKKVVKDIVYMDPVEPVNSWALYLKQKKKCDLVIVLSHCGFQGKYKDEPGDTQIAASLRNVDMIIGGHTHTDLRSPVYVRGADGRPVMIVTDYCWGLYVGQIKCISVKRQP